MKLLLSTFSLGLASLVAVVRSSSQDVRRERSFGTPIDAHSQLQLQRQARQLQHRQIQVALSSDVAAPATVTSTLTSGNNPASTTTRTLLNVVTGSNGVVGESTTLPVHCPICSASLLLTLATLRYGQSASYWVARSIFMQAKHARTRTLPLRIRLLTLLQPRSQPYKSSKSSRQRRLLRLSFSQQLHRLRHLRHRAP